MIRYSNAQLQLCKQLEALYIDPTKNNTGDIEILGKFTPLNQFEFIQNIDISFRIRCLTVAAPRCSHVSSI